MRLIFPVYLIAIGNVMFGVFDLCLSLIDHKPSTTIYGTIFSMIGITAGLIATVLQTQEKRIKELEHVYRK
jgi:hypothetical protein